MSVSLPPTPNLEQLRRQAKELLKKLRLEAKSPEEYRLADAQFRLARDYGFPSWPKLKAYVERVSGNGVFHPFRTDLPYYEERASGFLSLVQQGLPEAHALLRQHNPRFAGSEAIHLQTVTLEDAKCVLAAEHGFATWETFRRHIRALEKGETAEPFMAAFKAMETGDLPALAGVLNRHPQLIRAHGTNGNTLLHLALGIVMSPDHSRPPEVSAVDFGRALLTLLLERGADVNAPNNRGWTAMHQAGYCGCPKLVRGLLAAGGRTDLSAHGDGGTPLVQALFWGHHEAADILAEREVVPVNLRVAAGLGRMDLLRSLFHADGSLKPEAGARRAFYRPHSGFPVSNQQGDRRELLDEALVWAATNARWEAVDFILEQGADINGCPYRWTALAAVAGKGRTEGARMLLDRGADVNRRAVYGGTHHGRDVVALHPAAQCGHTETCRLLLEHGADPNHPDALYHSPPWGWAAHFGQQETRDLVLEYAWPGSVFAAVATGDLPKVRDAVARHPEQVNDTRYWGTPLVLAVRNGSKAIEELLLSAGANPQLPGKDGTTALKAREGG